MVQRVAIYPHPISTVNIFLSKLRNQHWYITVTVHILFEFHLFSITVLQDPIQAPHCTQLSYFFSPYWSDILSLLLITWTVLRNSGQVSCRMSPHSEFVFFSWLSLGLWVLGKNTTKKKCASYRIISGIHAIHMTSLEVSHLVKVGIALIHHCNFLSV